MKKKRRNHMRKSMILKRLGAFSLCASLLAGRMPTTAHAADTGKAIQLVTNRTADNISGAQADNIYFGTYLQSSDGNGGYNDEAIKWRVLSNSGGELLLLSDKNLDVQQYHSDYEGVTWERSTIRSWLNGYDASYNNGGNSGTDFTGNNFIDTAFSSGEQGAISTIDVVNDDNAETGTDGGNDTRDQIFLLSINEARNAAYGFSDNMSATGDSSGRISQNTDYAISRNAINSNGAGWWWLRSPGLNMSDAAYVGPVGQIDYYYGITVSHDNLAARPAFHLNLNSVLFTSAAAGGKIPAAAGGGNQGGAAAGEIFEIADYDGNEWKLTLLDNSRNFNIAETAAAGTPGGTVTLNYTGATVYDAAAAPNEYISVMIADGSGPQYYGRIAQPTAADGTVDLTIPDSLPDGVYTLYMFSEQYNGGANDDTRLTDYASAFEEVALTVSSDTTAPALAAGAVSRISDSAATVTFTSDEAGSYYYEVVDSGDPAPTIDTTVSGVSCAAGEQTISLTGLTAGAKDIYIAVKDAAGNVSQALKIEISGYAASGSGGSPAPGAPDSEGGTDSTPGTSAPDREPDSGSTTDRVDTGDVRDTGETDPDRTTGTPQTGDSFQPAFWTFLLIGSLAACIAVIIRVKRRRRSDKDAV